MIGILDAIGFGAARWFMPELQIYADYSDWLDMREGAQIGLAMAGVDSRIVPVDFQRFISWCGDCRVDLTEFGPRRVCGDGCGAATVSAPSSLS